MSCAYCVPDCAVTQVGYLCAYACMPVSAALPLDYDTATIWLHCLTFSAKGSVAAGLVEGIR